MVAQRKEFNQHLFTGGPDHWQIGAPNSLGAKTATIRVDMVNYPSVPTDRLDDPEHRSRSMIL